MDATIRVLRAGEEAVLERVADDVFDHAIDRDAAQRYLADPRLHLVVAIDDGLVVGMASGVHYFHPDKPAPELFINEVGVASSHSGRGIGRALVQALCAAAREAGCGAAWVLTDRSNDAALRMYRAAGGVETETPVMLTFRL